MLWNVCSQEVTACFMSASVANSLLVGCFLGGPNRLKSLGARSELQRGRFVAPYPFTSPVDPRKKHLARQQWAADADLNQAANPWVQTLDTYFHYVLLPRWSRWFNVCGEYVEVWCVPSATDVSTWNTCPIGYSYWLWVFVYRTEHVFSSLQWLLICVQNWAFVLQFYSYSLWNDKK
jgi:hypothetical protein